MLRPIVFMLYLFAVVLKILPTHGLISWKHYILPVVALSAPPISFITRLMRSSMLEVMRQDFIRTAQAKGLSELGVITKHALQELNYPCGDLPGTSHCRPHHRQFCR